MQQLSLQQRLTDHHTYATNLISTDSSCACTAIMAAKNSISPQLYMCVFHDYSLMLMCFVTGAWSLHPDNNLDLASPLERQRHVKAVTYFYAPF